MTLPCYTYRVCIDIVWLPYEVGLECKLTQHLQTSLFQLIYASLKKEHSIIKHEAENNKQ